MLSKLVLIINEASTELIRNLFRDFVYVQFINKNTRSTAVFEPGNEKENSTTINRQSNVILSSIKCLNADNQHSLSDILCRYSLCSLKYFSNILN